MPAASQAKEIPLNKLSIGQLADKFGPLDAASKLFKATTEKQLASVAAEIRSRYNEKPPTETFTTAGESYALIIGPNKMERTVTNRTKLRKALAQKFNEAWKVSLEFIDKWTTAEERQTFLQESLTGSRSISAVPKQ